MKSVFDEDVCTEIIDRFNKLSPESKAQWGKMDVAQMLAHCNVTYEMAYENIHAKPGAFKRIILKLFVKKVVVNEVPYKKNNPTAPEFKMAEPKEFEKEKERLITYIKKTQELGPDYFEGRESHSFGVLTSGEWNNMFYKHLDHHLRQFAV